MYTTINEAPHAVFYMLLFLLFLVVHLLSSANFNHTPMICVMPTGQETMHMKTCNIRVSVDKTPDKIVVLYFLMHVFR
jgi:hypothetical protein